MMKIVVVLLLVALVACSQARPESAADARWPVAAVQEHAVQDADGVFECLAEFIQQGDQACNSIWEFVRLAVTKGTNIPKRYKCSGADTDHATCIVEAIQGTIQDAADIVIAGVGMGKGWYDLVNDIIMKCFKKQHFLEVALRHH